MKMDKINNMYFEFRYVKTKGEAFAISSAFDIVSEKACYAKNYLEEKRSLFGAAGRKMKIELHFGYSNELKSAIGPAFCNDDEGYAVCVKEDVISLYGKTDRGLIYAAVTLYQLVEAGELREGVIFDYPDKAVRGYRVFTPGINEIKEFEAMIDMLVYYKYNTVMIEVGGAMEYKKHPIINEKWVEYCREVNQSPFEAERIQRKTFAWAKNSIHANNGGGGYISQEQMKKIVAYCRQRGFEVIPEVPSLSHSDYIVRAYPELNERKEDSYPDTYCPSNPKSYEVLFDLLDEVMEVFEPNYVNIGHDECYTLAICEKCKGKSPVDLYVGDIVKIRDFLETKGVKTYMWGEKVYGNVYVTASDGTKKPVGGTGNAARGIPRLAECAGKIPKDVTLLQWYWGLCSGEDEAEILKMGYRMIYGNFQAIALRNYRERIKLIDGGFVSNWGAVSEEYMQRNGQNYSLLTTAWIFWNADYDFSKSKWLHSRVKEALYKRYKKALGDDIIELVHTTDYYKKYKPFYDGYYIVREDWEIGNHLVSYTDGTTAKLPILYGYNIRNSFKDQNDVSGMECAESVVSADIEPLGASCSMEENGKIFYKTAYVNPYPEKEIENITVEAKPGIKIEAKYQ